MPPGAPDFTKRTRIMGNFGGVDVIVAVDPDGQLYALLKGYDGADYVPISVDVNGNLVAIMTGSDGISDITLLTDAAGRMISVIQDPVSGFNVAVDSDGYMTTIITGDDGGTLRTLTVDASGRLVGTLVDGTTGDPLSIDSDGFLTTVMKGIEGATLRTVAVDDAGNLVGVFKGDFEGALKTIATDTDGRLIAIMVDPLNIRGKRAVVGSGELAARLGSPVNFERRGTVVHINDASLGLSKGSLTTAGVGSTALLSASLSRTSGYSFELVSGTGAGAFAQITDSIDLVTYAGKVGLELSIATAGEEVYIIFGFDVYDGTNLTRYRIKWDLEDGKVYRYDDTPGYTDTGLIVLPIGGSTFQTFKLVVDLDAKTLLRLYSGATVTDLGGESAYSVLNAATPYLYDYCVITEDGVGAIHTGYVTDIIVTIAEEAT